MPEQFTIHIPATPSRLLSPNVRGHWGDKAAAFSDQMNLAYCHALPQRSHAFSADCRLRLDWVVAWEKGHKTMDDMNIKSSLKAFEDGIARALGVNDARFFTGEVQQGRDGEGRGWPEVTITIEEG